MVRAMAAVVISVTAARNLTLTMATLISVTMMADLVKMIVSFVAVIVCVAVLVASSFLARINCCRWRMTNKVQLTFIVSLITRVRVGAVAAKATAEERVKVLLILTVILTKVARTGRLVVYSELRATSSISSVTISLTVLRLLTGGRTDLREPSGRIAILALVIVALVTRIILLAALSGRVLIRAANRTRSTVMALLGETSMFGIGELPVTSGWAVGGDLGALLDLLCGGSDGLVVRVVLVVKSEWLIIIGNVVTLAVVLVTESVCVVELSCLFLGMANMRAFRLLSVIGSLPCSRLRICRSDAFLTATSAETRLLSAVVRLTTSVSIMN